MTHNLINHNHSTHELHPALEQLDWKEVIKPIFDNLFFDYTKIKQRRYPLYSNYEEINKSYNILDYFILHITNDTNVLNSILEKFPNKLDEFYSADRIKKAHILNISELNFIALLIEHSDFILDTLKIIKFNINFYKQTKNNFLKKFREFIDEEGTIYYERHPELNNIYNEIQKIEEGLRETIIDISRQPFFSNALQYNEYDVINDHYVLAIRSDSYRAEHGTIISKSNSGMTLLVEPPKLRDRVNKRLQLIAKLEEIISRICHDFSTILHSFPEEFLLLRDSLSEIDFFYSKANFCFKNNFVRPTLSNEFQIDIEGLFHPLISNPVKNSIVLDETKFGIVISGPNTGGKTATLKAISLCHLFIHFGIFIPATRASLTLVEGIFYFGNDQQNLSLGLSSFASEAKNYLELLNEVEGRSLIIIDEIFNSTSSEEASALALSLLEELQATKNCRVLISTHHHLFKTSIHLNPHFVSAHMQYDHRNNNPTYKIEYGHPGSSMAFEIFEKIANQYNFLGQKISNVAKTILDNKHISYEQLLNELSKKKSLLDNLIIKNTSLQLELKNQKSAMEGILKLEKIDIIDNFKLKLEKLHSRAITILDDVKKGEIQSNKQLQNKISPIIHDLNTEQNQLKSKSKTKELDGMVAIPSINDIKIGETYFSTILNKNVQVVNIDTRKETITVTHQKISIKCSLTDLLTHKNRIKFNTNIKNKQNIEIHYERTEASQFEFDCRGYRLDQFEATIIPALNDLHMGHIPFLSIIHGHGNGILKKWLRSHIAEDKDLKWESESNDGVTRIYKI